MKEENERLEMSLIIPTEEQLKISSPVAEEDQITKDVSNDEYNCI